jgi:hypothetical protein
MNRVNEIAGGNKKRRLPGVPRVLSFEAYEGLDLDMKVELIQALIPIGLMHVAELLEEEVKGLAGVRYSREGGQEGLVRYGFNAGSVRLSGHRVPISAPRVRNQKTRHEVPLESLRQLRVCGEVDP